MRVDLREEHSDRAGKLGKTSYRYRRTALTGWVGAVRTLVRAAGGEDSLGGYPRTRDGD